MRLTPEIVAHVPRPGMTAPGSIAYSPDDRFITYLFSERGDLGRDLWRLDLQTGERQKWLSPPGEGVTEANVSLAEALRRERQRVMTTGLTTYRWAKAATVLLLPIGEEVYRWRDGQLTRVADRASDAQISRDGRRIFFVRNAEVWCVDDAGERQLTTGSAPGVTNGLAEFVAQEELDRHHGYWPSPDGTRIAFAQADERQIPIYPIVHQATDQLQVEEHRYPFAGGPNALMRLGVISVADARPVTWLDLGAGEDLYLARVHWHPDGRLFVQILSRDQRRLELRAFDPETWSPRTLLVEESQAWINLHDDLEFVEGTGEFTWSSERSGYRHLYLYRSDGTLARQLTHGEWPVDGVRGIDARGRQVFFAAWTKTPVERHLHRVSLDGGDPVNLTREPGTHDGVVARDGSSFVDVFDSRTQPPVCIVRQPDGTPLWTLHAPSTIDLDLPTPELHTFQIGDGTTLHAALYRPPLVPQAGKGMPVIVAVYGGPHAQTVTDSWGLTVDLRAQLLAQEGFVVLKVDNRGSTRRGIAFESAISRRMGDIEVQDQTDGIGWLARFEPTDLECVGVYGWSYGGYLAAMLLVKAPELFTVGVAGAPVTSWDGYDTAYTERYMGTPATNPLGYRDSAVMTHVDRLRGKLMLVHGMLDENVHFRHTARLMQALIDAGKPFDILLYPNERHGPRSEKDRVAMERRILEYFKTHLAAGAGEDPARSERARAIRDGWWEFRNRAARSYSASRMAEGVGSALFERYRALEPGERTIVDQTVIEWLAARDEGVRWDALAIIGEFGLIAALPQLEELRLRLASATGPGAPFERDRVDRLIRRLRAG